MVCPVSCRKRKRTRQLVVERHGMACFYCQARLTDNVNDRDTYLTLDHLKPRSRGGRNTLRNLRPACRRCNNEKGDDDPDRWLARHRLTCLGWNYVVVS